MIRKRLYKFDRRDEGLLLCTGRRTISSEAQCSALDHPAAIGDIPFVIRPYMNGTDRRSWSKRGLLANPQRDAWTVDG
jgi:hypothetical protein